MANSPSIALIPSGYKANKIYSVLPTDGSADLTSSRASTATRVNKNGLIESVATGIPRLDYLNGGCPELLLEPLRRNVVTYSEDITQGVWQKNDTTIIASNILAPDGTNTATRLESTGANDACQFTHTGTIGINYTGSFYAKSVSGGGSTFIRVADAGSIQSITLTSEWQRFTFTASPTTTAVRLAVLLGDVGSQIDVWGFQLEDGGAGVGVDYPTSYIRTEGSAVTRIADAVTGNSSLGQVINSSEGVLYFEGRCLEDTSSSDRRITLHGDASNSIRIVFDTLGRVVGVVFSGASNQCTLTHAINLTNHLKIALKYKENDFALWVNGVEVATDPSGSTFSSSTLGELSFDSATGVLPFYGRIRDLRVYDTALTDAELTTLTTI